MRKISALVLTVLMTLALSLSAHAADGGTAYAILYDDGTLVFQNSNTPESGKTVTKTYTVDLSAVYSYSSHYAPWYDERESVHVVNFADKISPAATAYWFYECSNLERVDNIQNLDTANVTDMRYMFSGCSGLTALDVSKFDTKNVTDMSWTFRGCERLTELDVSKFDTANVKSMGDIFYGCSGLKALDLSKFDTKNVKSMSWMFKGCSGLTELDLSHFDTANVTDMQQMFWGCGGLKALDVSQFDTAKVTDMLAMFCNCGGLTELDLSHFDTKNVISMSDIFSGCSNLRTICVSDKFTTASVTFSPNMFKDCTSLVGGNDTKYDSSHTDKEYARIDTASAPGYFTAKDPAPAGVYAILYDDGTLVFQNGNTPESGKNVTKTYVVDLNETYDYSGSKPTTPWYDERESVHVANFADQISPAATAYWFFECSNLQRVDNIQNLDTANVTDMLYMFSGCSGLKALDVSHFDTKNVKSMFQMFSGCSGLTALNVSHFDTKNVTDMFQMFSGCSGLTALDLSRFDTKNVKSMSRMFKGCSGLKTLDLSKFDTKNVTDMDFMFSGCSGLTALDLSKFDTKNVTDMNFMFDGCSGLKTLDLSKFDTKNVTSMNAMFYQCSGLKTLDLSRFDTKNVKSMVQMFSGCSGLTALDLSHFDTGNVTDMSGIFFGCSGMKTIYASDKFKTASVTSSSDMFKDCASLVGGNETKFDESHTDKEYARIDTASAPGYFTDKNAPAPVPYEITALIPNPYTGVLLVKLTNPAPATVFVAYFDTKGQFLTTDMKAVPANAGSVKLKLLNVNRARVSMFDDQYRPLCSPYVSILGA